MSTPPRLYPITDLRLSGRSSHAELVDTLASAGCSWVQIRDKTLDDRGLTRAVADAVAASGGRVRVIVNDRPDVALCTGAGGAHVGDLDLPAADARRLLGPGAIVGLSSHSVDEALAAAEQPVDYVALGPIFATSGASVRRAPLGLEPLRRLRGRLSVPLVAIGGIDADNATSVLEAGADSVAVISAVMAAADLGAEARRLRRELEAWR